MKSLTSQPCADVFNAACPSRAVLEQLSEKWSLLILHLLTGGPKRTSDLKKAIGGVSKRC